MIELCVFVRNVGLNLRGADRSWTPLFLCLLIIDFAIVCSDDSFVGLVAFDFEFLPPIEACREVRDDRSIGDKGPCGPGEEQPVSGVGMSLVIAWNSVVGSLIGE